MTDSVESVLPKSRTTLKAQLFIGAFMLAGMAITAYCYHDVRCVLAFILGGFVRSMAISEWEKQ